MARNFGNAERQKLDREAREQQLAAAAATGEPTVTAFDLEKARRKYVQPLGTAELIRDGRARDELNPDQRAAEVKRWVDGSELDRTNYEHLRVLFEGQQARRTAAGNARLANANFAVVVAIMIATIFQAWAAFHPR